MIIALDVQLEIIERRFSAPDFHQQWEMLYIAFFRTLTSSFPSVRRFRLTLSLEPLDTREHRFSNEDGDRLLGPWEQFVDHRGDWGMIELRVPESWKADLRPRVNAHGGYTLGTILDNRRPRAMDCGIGSFV